MHVRSAAVVGALLQVRVGVGGGHRDARSSQSTCAVLVDGVREVLHELVRTPGEESVLQDAVRKAGLLLVKHAQKSQVYLFTTRCAVRVVVQAVDEVDLPLARVR